MFPPDEQEGESNKVVRQMRPNMKTPAVKATGKGRLLAPTLLLNSQGFEKRNNLSALVEGLSLLGAYEDSDEEDSGNVNTSATNTQLNHSADIDSTLANFMAVSIDFITFDRLLC